MKNTAFKWNIPNVLSLYRIIASPFIIYVAFNSTKNLFITLLCINLFTDILDGFIARRFNMVTAIGAKLDSVADIFTYLCAAIGLWKFEWFVVTEHLPTLLTFFILYILGFVIALIKFRKILGLHIYTFKITGYVQGTFILVLFIWGYFALYYYFMIALGIWANIEDIIITFLLKEPRSNVKGLYWVLKDYRK